MENLLFLGVPILKHIRVVGMHSYSLTKCFILQGCYDAARDFIEDQSTMMLGIGFSFCVFLVRQLS